MPIATVEVRIDEKELKRYLANLAATIAMDIAKEAEKILDDEGITYRGYLKRSVEITPYPEEGGATLLYTMPYAYYVEYGRGPGKKPPFEPIFRWVVSKLNVLDKQEAITVAHKIRSEIGARGTKPTLFLHRAASRVLRKWGVRLD